MAIALNSKIVRLEGVMFSQIDDDLVILNMARNNYVNLDATGRRIWELLEKPVHVDELCGQLVREFAATKEQITADVLPFLAELEKDGLVRVVD
ncbi:MAG TPA: PqqD family protein [Kiritimatiellia bacterium]|nr:PqqD family protein [Kiritimatiellia bacterium]